jgi:hypothetical protein
MRLRVFVLALLLIPLNCYFVAMGEVFYYPLHSTAIVLFYNAINTLFLLMFINAILRRFNKIFLNRGEILTLYIMLCMATSLCGHDMMQILMTSLGHAHWFANEQNQWKEKFFQYLPSWLIVSDKEALYGLYNGGASFFENLKAFWLPMTSWGIFTLILFWCFYCLNCLYKDGWIFQERLTFPVAQIPLEITDEKSHLLKSRLFWLGCAFAGALDIWHGLHFLFPYLPDLQTRWDLSPYIVNLSPPWNAIGWTPLCFYPFAVGLSYFIPTDLAFSCWFFYLFWKLQMVVRSFFGIPPMPGPYQSAQSSGAWIGIGVIALWGARKYMKQVYKGAGRKYLWGFLFGLVSLCIFSALAGMSAWVSALFFLIYFLICVAIARMRAELGPPTHDLYFAGPDWILTSFLGTKLLGNSNLVMFTLFYWITRDYRSHPIGHQLEGFKIASQEKGMKNLNLLYPILYACAIGFVSSFFAFLYIFNTWGLVNKLTNYYGIYLAAEAFNRLDRWLTQPQSPDFLSIRHFSYGFLFVSFLFGLKKVWPFNPFHPVGYAVAGSWTMSHLWFSVFLSWLIKVFLLKFGGLKIYKTYIPFFLGLIVGEFSIGALWIFWGIISKTEVYRFFI